MTHATCKHLTRNGKHRQIRRCWQCKLDPMVVEGGSNLCDVCCARRDRCKCRNHLGPRSGIHTTSSQANKTATIKKMLMMKRPCVSLNLPTIHTNENKILVTLRPSELTVAGHFQRSHPIICQHISIRTGRPRNFKRCWQCKLDPTVVGGGEELCGKHFMRRDKCKCPPLVKLLAETRAGLDTIVSSNSVLHEIKAFDDTVTNAHLLLSLQPNSSAATAQCAVRRQRVLSKYSVVPPSTGFGMRPVLPKHTVDAVAGK